MTDPVLLDLDIPGLPPPRRGKVRNVFDLGDRLLFVATDRISAFDCILPTGIPGKGRLLTQLSIWWFQRLAHVIPNHVWTTEVDEYPDVLKPHRDQLRGRSMIVCKARVIPVECVARGYIAGGGWKEYQSTGAVSGVPLRAGYRLAEALDAPIFTPAHKAETGHDENISFEETVRRIGAEPAERLRAVTLSLYTEAAAYARTRGLLIADTKFEFGIRPDGELILIDEVLTPDSSRFWPIADYAPGQSPPSFDKQYVRDYLETLEWDKRPPAPPLPSDIAERTAEKYREAFRRLTGRDAAA